MTKESYWYAHFMDGKGFRLPLVFRSYERHDAPSGWLRIDILHRHINNNPSLKSQFSDEEIAKIQEKMALITFVLEVIDNKPQYKIINNKQEHIGRLEKIRLGTWMSWCLFLNPDCYMSASCLDETREKIKRLNAMKGKFEMECLIG